MMPTLSAMSAFNDAARRSKTRPGTLMPGTPSDDADTRNGFGLFDEGAVASDMREQAAVGRFGAVRTGAGDRRGRGLLGPSTDLGAIADPPFGGNSSIRSRRGGRSLSIAPKAPVTPNADAIRREKVHNEGDEAADEIIAALGGAGIEAQVTAGRGGR